MQNTNDPQLTASDKHYVLHSVLLQSTNAGSMPSQFRFTAEKYMVPSNLKADLLKYDWAWVHVIFINTGISGNPHFTPMIAEPVILISCFD